MSVQNNLCASPEIPEGYIIVRKGDGKGVEKALVKNDLKLDAKSQTAAISTAVEPLQRPMGRAVRLARSGLGEKTGGGTHFKTKLYEVRAVTGGVATAIATAYPMQLNNSAEYASFASLFDDYKVTAVTVHYSTLQLTGNTLNPQFGILAYDATYGTAPVSIATQMEADSKSLFCTQPPNGSPLWSTASGLAKFKFKVPSVPILLSAAVSGGSAVQPNMPGAWMAFGDTLDTFGYLKTYVEAVAGVNIAVRYVFEYDVICRQRT